jgi:malate dehydrogenase
MTVAIIGAGDLGAATAQALAARDRIRRIVMIDEAAAIAAGKALDIQQSGAVDGFHTRLDGTSDTSAVTGALACVIADRAGARPAEWQGEEGLAMLGRLLPFAAHAPLIFAGAMQADLILHAARELRAPRERLVGSAPEAFASAVRAIVALEARCSPGEVMLSVLGRPSGFVVPWSEASIAGYSLERVLTQVQLTRIDARAARLWPPGPHTLGLAAARAVEAVATSSRASLSAFTLLGGEFGVRDRVGAVPVLLSTRGIVHVRVPDLNTRERVQLETALGR